MSRTIFQNACIATKTDFSHDVSFERVQCSMIKVDMIGSLDVPVSYYLAKYEFLDEEFYGTGSSKKMASENLFSRLVASSYIPKVPMKDDPTAAMPKAVYKLTFTREDLQAALSFEVDVGDPELDVKSDLKPLEIPRGRHEALMSLVRHLLRESAI